MQSVRQPPVQYGIQISDCTNKTVRYGTVPLPKLTFILTIVISDPESTGELESSPYNSSTTCVSGPSADSGSTEAKVPPPPPQLFFLASTTPSKKSKKKTLIPTGF